MTTKAIYRTAIVNKDYIVTYLSNIFYDNRDLAVNRARKIFCEKEKKIKNIKGLKVCVNINNKNIWKIFEIIKNDNNRRYIGIITETLVLEAQ